MGRCRGPDLLPEKTSSRPEVQIYHATMEVGPRNPKIVMASEPENPQLQW